MNPTRRSRGGPTRLPLSKRIAFSVILILFLLASFELASFVGYGMMTGEAFSWSAPQIDRAAVIDQFEPGSDSGWEATREVVHPFVGFVSNPDRAPGLSQYGYPKSSQLGRQRTDDRVVIAVVGGSVAQGFAAAGLPVVIEQLQRDPAYAGKEIVAVDLAVGGYKQPQQLMTLTYLLTLGFEFDVVLNIDGFNEVALHQAENGKKQVSLRGVGRSPATWSGAFARTG